MNFNGYTIDNIDALKMHFSVQDMLCVIGQPMVLKAWFANIQDSGVLEVSETEALQELQRRSAIFLKDEGNVEWEDIVKLSDASDLTEHMKEWEEKVSGQKTERYRRLAALMIGFISLAEYKPDKKDEDLIFTYFTQEGYMPLLQLKNISEDRAGVYCRGELVTSLKLLKSFTVPECAVFFVSDPDTGFIGIDKAGNIINGSAFHIEEVDEKAVIACLSHAGYSVLLENGRIIHNLKYSRLPETPVKAIELHNDELTWIPV